MNNELCFNGFSAVTENEILDVNGGFNPGAAMEAVTCAVGAITVAKYAPVIAAVVSPQFAVACIVICGAATAYHGIRAAVQ